MLILKIIGFVLLGLLGLLVLLLIVPVRLRVRYANELRATLFVLFVPIRLAPAKDKPQQDESEDKPKPKDKKVPEQPKKKKSSSFAELLDLKEQAVALKRNGLSAAIAWLKAVAARVLKAADRLLRAITVTRLVARVDIAGEDAAQTALTYGRVCGAVYPALGAIESRLKVKRQEVVIAPAFCLEETRFAFDVRLKISVWRVAVALLVLLISYMKMPTVGELKEQQTDKVQPIG